MRASIRLACALTALLCCASAYAAESDQYIVVLSLHGELTDAAVTAAGGVVTERFWDHVVASLTPSAIEALSSNHAVKYIQRIGQAVDPPSSERPQAQVMAVPPRSRPDWVPTIWSSGGYQYDGSGNITAIGSATSPPSTDGRSNSYSYDVDSCLTSWGATAVTTQNYAYDVYGNLTSGVSVDAATNRLTGSGISYDVAGNQLNNGTYGYDSLNMMTKKVGSETDGTTWYVYTPDDERIGSLQPTIDKWNWSLRGFDHDVLREYQSSNGTPASAWVWIEDHVYRGSGLLLAAERPPAEGGQRHFHLDHLGTPRLVTGPNGGLVALHDYAPFGAEVTNPCQEKNLGFDREEPHRFTLHERDFAASCADTSALDYMHARAYSSVTARFLSVDPLGGYQHNPKSWDRYTYVLNGPLNLLDPTGTEVEPAEFWGYISVCDACNRPGFDLRPSGWFGGNDVFHRYLGMFNRVLHGNVDYMTVTFAIPVPFTSGLGSAQFGVTAARGKLYPTVGGGIGRSFAGPTGSVAFGTLMQAKTPTDQQLANFIEKLSFNYATGALVGAGGTYSPGMPADVSSVAGEFGVYAPQIGVSGSYTFGPLP